MEHSYIRIKNGKVVTLIRCRQRNNCESFKFISFREMKKVHKYNTISKL